LEISEVEVQTTLSLLLEALVFDDLMFAWDDELVVITDDSSISLGFAFTENIQLVVDAKDWLPIEIV